VVTGAGRGIGRGVVLHLAALGAKVVVTDINLDSAAEFAEELAADSVVAECEALGTEALGIEADLTDRAQAAGMIAQAHAHFGRLDILVNVAGGMLMPAENSAPSQMSEEEYRFIMDVNLTSAIYCCQAAVPLMAGNRWGRIVNTSSQAAVNLGALMTSYAMSKMGVLTFSRSLAVEVGPQGITVNCVAPGLIRTSRRYAEHPGTAAAADRVPLRRIGEPLDVARVVEFYCSELGDYITGQCVGVCGGLVAQAI
jgi:NAD(P)-dependent dehydrogenase (short-subunit alcohol dehydrogenase family)